MTGWGKVQKILHKGVAMQDEHPALQSMLILIYTEEIDQRLPGRFEVDSKRSSFNTHMTFPNKAISTINPVAASISCQNVHPFN